MEEIDEITDVCTLLTICELKICIPLNNKHGIKSCFKSCRSGDGTELLPNYSLQMLICMVEKLRKGITKTIQKFKSGTSAGFIFQNVNEFQ